MAAVGCVICAMLAAFDHHAGEDADDREGDAADACKIHGVVSLAAVGAAVLHRGVAQRIAAAARRDGVRPCAAQDATPVGARCACDQTSLAGLPHDELFAVIRVRIVSGVASANLIRSQLTRSRCPFSRVSSIMVRYRPRMALSAVRGRAQERAICAVTDVSLKSAEHAPMDGRTRSLPQRTSGTEQHTRRPGTRDRRTAATSNAAIQERNTCPWVS